MGLSRSLARLTRHLIRGDEGRTEAFVHPPSELTLGFFIVVSTFRSDEGAVLKGTGVARSQTEAYLKSAIELGEVLCSRQNGISTRNGMAGGLLLHSAIERARAELLERDAFLFHYRKGVPFRSSEIWREGIPGASGRGRIMVFELSSAVGGLRCVLATDEASIGGDEGCLWFGLAAHPDREAAARKAVGEYACMNLDHALRPGWCADVFAGTRPASRLPDLHHAASRDPRNRRRFHDLCGVGESESRFRQGVSIEWSQAEVPSPLRYFRYARASSPLLDILEFGVSESVPAGEPPLLHPVW